MAERIDFDALDIAYTMRKASRALHSLFPDYEKRIQPTKDVINRVMQEKSEDVLPATIDLLEVVARNDNDIHGNIYGAWLLAAAYDMITESAGETLQERIRRILKELAVEGADDPTADLTNGS